MSIEIIRKISTDHPTSNAQLAHSMKQKVTKNFIGRHVAWIKDQKTIGAKIGASLLAIGEVALLSLTVVGLIPVIKAFSVSKKLNAYKKMEADIKVSKPPSKTLIEFKTATRTFNHINDYAIQDGKLWYRPHSDLNAEWELMYYDQNSPDNPPMEIKADGANLMVRDKNNTIHYKKALSEWRDWNGDYHCKDKSGKDNWYDAWFSFPLLDNLYHLFQSKRIKLPEGVVDWAMSHRGIYCNHFEDVENRKHPEFAMVTTLYAIPKDGRDILYADPFLMSGFNHRIKGPDPKFQGMKIAASASTIFLMGMQEGKLTLYTRLADFDTIGKNPFLPCFWSSRFGPSQKWKKEPDVPLVGSAKITGNISIHQDGQGNKHRMLEVSGTDRFGRAGYYYKHIDDREWKFKTLQVAT